jgi:hypothetical protein
VSRGERVLVVGHRCAGGGGQRGGRIGGSLSVNVFDGGQFGMTVGEGPID